MEDGAWMGCIKGCITGVPEARGGSHGRDTWRGACTGGAGRKQQVHMQARVGSWKCLQIEIVQGFQDFVFSLT